MYTKKFAESIQDDVCELIGRKVSVDTTMDLVELIFDSIRENLKNGEPINIIRFGEFTTMERKGRTINHPKSGEEITIDSMVCAKFKPSDYLKKDIRK